MYNHNPVSYTHLDVYKRQLPYNMDDTDEFDDFDELESDDDEDE